MSNFYENIKSIRISKKLTQAEMSEKLDITEVHYNRIENNKVDISLSKMNKLADIFGMTLIELLQYGDEKIESKETILIHTLGFNLKFLIREIRGVKSQIAMLARWITNDKVVYDKLNEKYLDYQKVKYEKDLEEYSCSTDEAFLEEFKNKESSMYKANYERTLEQYFNLLNIILTVRLSKQLPNKNIKIDIEELLNTDDFKYF